MSKKYETIAVGTDGSDSALEAVRTAASLAAAYDATLVLVCAHYNSTGSLLNSPQADSSSIPVVSRSNAEEFLAEARSTAEEEGATKFELRAHEGTPVEVLLDAITDLNADLLVVGNRGMNSLTGRVFGNIPTGVARKSPVDVMLVNTSAIR